jgi:regulator of protease activity HflC (stomatin/prohibitin superfamily)
MQKIINLVLAVLLILAILVYLCCFEVSEGWIAVGAGNVVYHSGLQVKWPWQKINLLNVHHQAIDLSESGKKWLVVAEITEPKAYLENSRGSSVSDLVEQAWSSDPMALPQAPLLLKNGVTILTVLQTGVILSDADQVAISQKMPALFTTISQNILSSGEAQAQNIRATAQANFLATQQQALDLAAQVISPSQTAAIKMLAAAYQKNPVLFKAYMQTTAQLFKNTNS